VRHRPWTESSRTGCGGFIPKGWYDLEQVNYSRLYRVQLDGAFDPAKRIISASRTEANLKELEREFSSGLFGKIGSGFLRHRILAEMLLPALSKIPLKGAKGPGRRRPRGTGLRAGKIPPRERKLSEALAALAPKFISTLPTDGIEDESPSVMRRYLYGLAGERVGGQRGNELRREGSESFRTISVREAVSFQRAGQCRVVGGDLALCALKRNLAERRQEHLGQDPVAQKTAPNLPNRPLENSRSNSLRLASVRLAEIILLAGFKKRRRVAPDRAGSN